jgi:hypothetical protein
MIKKQRGATFIGMLFIAAAVIFVAIVAVKLIPPYIEYFTIKKILVTMRNAGDLKNSTPKEIRASFERRATVDNITAIKPEELEISKEGEEAVVTATYSQKVPIMGNVSACLDFSASTGNE